MLTQHLTDLCQDPERTQQVYQACLDLIPHKKVTWTCSSNLVRSRDSLMPFWFFSRCDD